MKRIAWPGGTLSRSVYPQIFTVMAAPSRSEVGAGVLLPATPEHLALRFGEIGEHLVEERDRLSPLAAQQGQPPLAMRLGADQHVLALERLAPEHVQHPLELRAVVPHGLPHELLDYAPVPFSDLVDGEHPRLHPLPGGRGRGV